MREVDDDCLLCRCDLELVEEEDDEGERSWSGFGEGAEEEDFLMLRFDLSDTPVPSGKSEPGVGGRFRVLSMAGERAISIPVGLGRSITSTGVEKSLERFLLLEATHLLEFSLSPPVSRMCLERE